MELTIIMSVIILIIAISMSMVGKGGGNFYVLAMIFAGISMSQAAMTSQLIMMGTALASVLVFHKHHKIDWKLAVIIDTPTNIMALIGGYYAESIDASILKIIFAVVLIVASIFMFVNVKEKPYEEKHKLGFWNRKFGDYTYTVNLWITLPLTAIVGFVAGAVGISGGAFKIPLMVMLCGIPMPIAIGTSSAMVALTALMGFVGHSLTASVDWALAIPLVLVAVIGGVVGSKFSINRKSKNLKKIFAITNLIAAVIMIINIIM